MFDVVRLIERKKKKKTIQFNFKLFIDVDAV